MRDKGIQTDISTSLTCVLVLHGTKTGEMSKAIYIFQIPQYCLEQFGVQIFEAVHSPSTSEDLRQGRHTRIGER